MPVKLRSWRRPVPAFWRTAARPPPPSTNRWRTNPWEDTPTCLCRPISSRTWTLKPSSIRGTTVLTSRLQVAMVTVRQLKHKNKMSEYCRDSHQAVRWTSLRSADPSWRRPSPRPRWSIGALSSTRGPWRGGPWRPLPAPSPHPPASPLSVKSRSPAPAPRTRRPCTTACRSPAGFFPPPAAGPRCRPTKRLPG